MPGCAPRQADRTTRPDRRARFRLECLEDRWVPAFPVAAGDVFAVPNGPNTLNVLANDAFSQQAQISSFTQVPAAQGTLTQNADGTFTFTPAPGFTGTQFSYTLSPKTPETRLNASDPVASAAAGYSVSVSADGNTAVVAAPDATGGSNGTTAGAGSVYVFARTDTGWAQQQKLFASGDAGAGTAFGTSVAISGNGNVIAVGDPDATGGSAGATAGAGAVYVFTRSGGSFGATPQKLFASGDAGAGTDFGTSVALSGDGTTLAVGDVSATGVGPGSGAVYVFTSSGSTFGSSGQKLFAQGDLGAGDDFGRSVSLSSNGNFLAVGDPNATGGTTDSTASAGAVYIFVRVGGMFGSTPAQKLFASGDAGAGTDFGTSVALSGDGKTLAVGDPNATGGKDGTTAGAGAAYVFSNPGTGFGATPQKLFASGDASAGTTFGTSVALDGTGSTLVVGDPTAGGSGAAYVYKRSGTPFPAAPTKRLADSGSGGYGTSVSLSSDGNTVLVGAPQTTTGGAANAGAAFVEEIGTSTALVSLAPQQTLARTVGVSGPAGGQAQVFRFDSSGSMAPTGDPFQPFQGFTGDVRTATGDVDGDGTEDTVYGIGPGGGSVIRVITSTGIDTSVSVYEAGFTGGVFLALADIDGDGKDEIFVSPDVGGGGRIVGFKLEGGRLVQFANFFGIEDASFRGGARVAAGDINHDGTPDLVVAAGFGGGPRVALFDGKKLLATPNPASFADTEPLKLTGDFFVFEQTLRNGVFVGAGDFNGDGFADVIFGGGPGGGPRVMILSGQQLIAGNSAGAIQGPIANFFAGDPNQRGGIRVAAKDIDNDNLADLVSGSGEGFPAHVRTYSGKAILATSGQGEPSLLQDLPAFGGGVSAAGIFVG